jgi:hypothetical protein
VDAINEISKKNNRVMDPPKNPVLSCQKNKEKNVFSSSGKGAFSGIKTKNKHLAEFERMKDGFAKKKGIFLDCYFDMILFILTI